MFDINKYKHVNDAICEAMNDLVNTPFCENFGEEHIRVINEKFGSTGYYDGEDFSERERRLNNISGFESWCAYYTPIG